MEYMDLNIIRESITCPITSNIMSDPVQGNDGHTYERSAILEWLRRNPISPQTRQPMHPSDLKVNAAIRYLCDKYHNGEFAHSNLASSQVTSEANNEQIISKNEIVLNDEIVRNSDNKTMIIFDINPDTFPANLENNHLSQDIILVIDRSGSMNQAIKAKNENGENLENGMSVQDIVNHAAKTVTKTLNNNSRIAIIIFDNTIETLLPLTLMTEINKNSAIQKINNIKPRNETNIWGAYISALNIIDTREDKTRNSAIIIFTDGCPSPSLSPARGEVETLKKLREKNNYPTPLYIFGFGYSLRKNLLYDMAKYANGGNGHIPDGGMIATVFCNFTATILCTVVINLQLHIKSNNPDQNNLTHLLMGDYPSKKNIDTNYTIFDLGTIQYQQARNIILNTDQNSNFTYFYTYEICGEKYKSDEMTINHTNYANQANQANSTNTNIEIDSHINRYAVVETCREMIKYNKLNDYNKSKELFENLVLKLKKSKSKDSNMTLGLLNNLEGDDTGEGQINLAINNRNYFEKWGEFYIDQLSRCMNQQMKPNYKDQGCPFGGDIFESIVDRASDIFDSIPPPEPSLINNVIYNTRNNYYPHNTNNHNHLLTPQRINTLADYNNPNGGCFDSNCKITMADGSEKLLKTVNKGDKIRSINKNNMYTTATIVCVLEIKIKNGIREFVNLSNGLYITPWHPIRYNKEWIFPANLKSPIIKSCESIITLVLDKDHIGFINGYECIMLGHGFTDGILNHAYYGTNRVIDDLKKNYGWPMGRVTVYDTEIEFIKQDNKVTNIKYTPMFNPEIKHAVLCKS